MFPFNVYFPTIQPYNSQLTRRGNELLKQVKAGNAATVPNMAGFNNAQYLSNNFPSRLVGLRLRVSRESKVQGQNDSVISMMP